MSPTLPPPLCIRALCSVQGCGSSKSPRCLPPVLSASPSPPDRPISEQTPSSSSHLTPASWIPHSRPASPYLPAPLGRGAPGICPLLHPLLSSCLSQAHSNLAFTPQPLHQKCSGQPLNGLCVANPSGHFSVLLPRILPAAFDTAWHSLPLKHSPLGFPASPLCSVGVLQPLWPFLLGLLCWSLLSSLTSHCGVPPKPSRPPWPLSVLTALAFSPGLTPLSNRPIPLAWSSDAQLSPPFLPPEQTASLWLA